MANVTKYFIHSMYQVLNTVKCKVASRRLGAFKPVWWACAFCRSSKASLFWEPAQAMNVHLTLKTYVKISLQIVSHVQGRLKWCIHMAWPTFCLRFQENPNKIPGSSKNYMTLKKPCTSVPVKWCLESRKLWEDGCWLRYDKINPDRRLIFVIHM